MRNRVAKKWPWALLVVTCAAGAEPSPSLDDALTAGRVALDLRLRAEHVDNESPIQVRDATATTLRARLGYATGSWHALDAGLEYEGTTAWDKRDYNDGSATSPETQRPVIADPAGSELNQAWIRYAGIPRTSLKAGRQRFTLDSQRFIGNSGWRQNEQTYDGAALASKPLEGLELALAYFHNANAPGYVNIPVKAQLANVAYAPGPWLKAAAYGYRLDFASIAGNRQDSETLGLRLSGTIELTSGFKPLYALEHARQSGYADAPGTVDARYWLAESGALIGPATVKLGYEVLGSNDGAYALQTPLATLHAFNGWADLFLVTPAAGLRDAYASAAATLGQVTLTTMFHAFGADVGGADYGTELDASLGYALTARFGALLKFADYDAETFATDTRKAWLQLEYRF